MESECGRKTVQNFGATAAGSGGETATTTTQGQNTQQAIESYDKELDAIFEKDRKLCLLNQSTLGSIITLDNTSIQDDHFKCLLTSMEINNYRICGKIMPDRQKMEQHLQIHQWVCKYCKRTYENEQIR